MQSHEIRETLQRGGMVYGFMLSAVAVNRWGQALAGSTVDYAVIDWEHGSRDRREIQELCTMLRAGNIAPIVRVPEPKAVWVAMALDAGAGGVLVPYCEDVDEVRACVATARWHPMKGEYLKRAVTTGEFPSETTRTYLDKRHNGTVVIIGIESEPGLRNLPEILAVGGIDGIFVGPNDMTTSLGIPDEVTHPRYLDVLREVIRLSEGAGAAVMIHQQTLDTSITAIELGARFVLHCTDARLLQLALQEHMATLRQAGARVRGAASGAAAAKGGVDPV
ncbi:MAG: HpcH/HpaI aldolase family protein [Dehalococcoidia bacterium]